MAEGEIGQCEQNLESRQLFLESNKLSVFCLRKRV